MPPHTGDPVPTALAKATVLDPRGDRVEVGSLWAEGPCALVFLRHFGCPACAENVTELLPRLAELRALSVRVALVGSGEPEHMAPFASRVGLEDRGLDLFTDPTLAAYRAAGLVRSAWATYGPVALFEMTRLMARGHAHLETLGDRLQQGGTLLVDHRGRLAFYHRNTSVGSYSPLVDLVDAAVAARVRRSEFVL